MPTREERSDRVEQGLPPRLYPARMGSQDSAYNNRAMIVASSTLCSASSGRPLALWATFLSHCVVSRCARLLNRSYFLSPVLALLSGSAAPSLSLVADLEGAPAGDTAADANRSIEFGLSCLMEVGLGAA